MGDQDLCFREKMKLMNTNQEIFLSFIKPTFAYGYCKKQP
jgi:hypothetical protein